MINKRDVSPNRYLIFVVKGFGVNFYKIYNFIYNNYCGKPAVP
ncbi:hypothetical protein RG47T_4712 [Mucilaginibacter polytrichastri]|uniref:Uncharacterized protein n=1 Tax=Mucilaginibacter polytrichastri TaxID=1302689 RepID=A0A1Q6A5E1_9SPHI|nr:hypothetical protein RG47T_4712 [Mucilaginibacter polytrichastri]